MAARARHSPPVTSVRKQLLCECEAMIHHALGSGLAVPPSVVETVERALVQGHHRDRGSANGSSEPRSVVLIENEDLAALTRAHSVLAQLIEPATPRGVLLLSTARRTGWLNSLGPVRLIRQMLVLVVFLLLAFVLLALSPDVNTSSGDIFRSSGIKLLVNEGFYLTAGGLGGAFYALFTAYRYIAAGAYDPTYESSYWIRFILGLMAGILLPSLVPLGHQPGQVSRPLLALVGGFSAAVLYRILERLVQTVESLAEGDARPLQAARQDAMSARAVVRSGEDRLALVGELVHLRDRVGSGASTADVSSALDHLLLELLPERPGDVLTAPAAPPPHG